jgi:hypothetical protein
MNRSLLKTIALAAGIAALPAIGQAAQQSQVMNSCVNAYLQSLSRSSGPVKLRETHLLRSSASPGILPPSASQLVLTATDAHDNHTVGRAICRLDSRGQVLQIEQVRADSLPID